MKKSIITLLIIAMLACIGLVSCKNEIQAPAEELVSVSFDNDSARALSASLEKFEPEKYYWKYAAKKADGSNLISGQTASYNEAGALWIKEGKPGFEDEEGTFKVQGFSQGLWNFTLYGYKWTDGDLDEQIDPLELQLVYSGETTGHLLKAGTNDTHSVSVVVSPAQGGYGTLWVKITGEDAIYLDRALPIEAAANTKTWLTVEKVGGTSKEYDGFISEDYKPSLYAGAYKVTVKFTNDDGEVVYASGSVVATVYSGLTTTVKGNLTEIVTYADFGAKQNPDIITTTIGTSEITQGTTSSTVNFTSTTATKVTASMPTSAAKSLIAEMEQALDAKTSTAESTTSELTLNLSVNTTAATETTITYEIGMEATLEYQKKDATGTDKTTTKSTVETLDDFVTVKIELQRGLTDVKVRHSDELMTACSSLSELNNKQVPGPDASEEAKAEARKGYFYYQDPYENDSSKAMLYIRTYKFSPFTLSYTVPKVVAIIGSQQFETLESAIAASTGADTITMVSSVTLTKDIQVGENELTIDLNGFTVTGSDHILPDEVYFTVEEKYGDYYDYEYDPGYIRIRHKEASIGTTLYNRLPQAFLAVTDSTPTTIVVKRDSVVIVKNSASTPSTPKFTGNAGITIAAGRDITLDLNGHTVKNAVNEDKASQVLLNRGTLTIMDSSDTAADGTGMGLLTNDVMEGTHPGDWWSTPQYNYATNVISNNGTLIVNSGKILQTANKSICYAIDNVTNGNVYPVVELTVNGGHIYNFFTNAIRMFCNSTTANNKVSVTGGIISGYGGAIWPQGPNKNANKVELDISGGTFYTTEKAVVNGTRDLCDAKSSIGFQVYDAGSNGSSNYSSESIVRISGGEFHDDIKMYIYSGQYAVESGSLPRLEITGGTFYGYVYTNGDNASISGGSFRYYDYGNGTTTISDMVDEGMIAEGYGLVPDETEGFYTVKALTWLDFANTSWYDETKSSFEIGTAVDLAGVSKLVLEGKTFRGKTILLTADINLSDHIWIPIGNGTFSFQGSVDGQTHDIIGLKNGTKDMLPESVLSAWGVTQIGNEGIPYGFIGTIGSTTNEGDPITITISNVDFVGVDIDIDYANFIGVVFAADTAAAKVGSSYINPSLADNISLSKVTVSGTIKSTNMSGSTVGGVVGKLYTLGTLSVDQCTNNASFTITSNSKLGGIVGSKYHGTMSVSNCVNNGDFLVNLKASASGTTSIGGIAVLWNGTGEITGCTNNGKMTNDLSDLSDVTVYSSSIGNIAVNNIGKMTFTGNAVGSNASGWDSAYMTNGSTRSEITFSGIYENTGSGWVLTSAN